MRIKAQFDLVNLEIDGNKNNVKRMEHFIDKYIPIRTQQQIGDTLKSVLSQSMLQRLQNFEMEKMNKLNEDLLDDETNPELIDLMRKVASDLMDLLHQFKAIAKAKGIRYNIAAAKKDAIEAQIMGSKDGTGSLDGKSILEAANKALEKRPSSVENVEGIPRLGTQSSDDPDRS